MMKEDLQNILEAWKNCNVKVANKLMQYIFKVALDEYLLVNNLTVKTKNCLIAGYEFLIGERVPDKKYNQTLLKVYSKKVNEIGNMFILNMFGKKFTKRNINNPNTALLFIQTINKSNILK